LWGYVPYAGLSFMIHALRPGLFHYGWSLSETVEEAAEEPALAG
jgi:hypothetical protein